MKKFLFALGFAAFTFASASAQTTTTRGYTKANGTTVAPYIRTQSNGTNADNWSTQGNANPQTGTNGSRAQDYSAPASNYGGGQPVQTGPRGGQYYTNDNGRKVYVPKR